MSDPRRRVPSVDAVLRETTAEGPERKRLASAVREVLATRAWRASGSPRAIGRRSAR